MDGHFCLSQVSVRHNHQKLVSPITGNEVRRPKVLLKQDGNLRKDSISGQMAEFGVEVLEPVDIGQHHRQLAPRPLRSRRFSGQSFLHKTAVEHSCHGIRSRHLLCGLQLHDQLPSRPQQNQSLLKQIDIQ